MMLYLFLFALVTLIIWGNHDLKNNPEKYAEMDAQRERRKAAKKEREYQEAMQGLSAKN
jgi:hypothetical protein